MDREAMVRLAAPAGMGPAPAARTHSSGAHFSRAFARECVIPRWLEMTIGELFRLILPVFALIAVGVALRRFHWVEGTAETSMLRLVVYVCMPCLVFDTIIGNASLRDPGNLLLPPLAGFVTTAAGFGVAYLAGRRDRAREGHRPADVRALGRHLQLQLPAAADRRRQSGARGRRASSSSTTWGSTWRSGRSGSSCSTGASPREGWRKLVTPMLVTLLVAVAINALGLSRADVPGLRQRAWRIRSACAPCPSGS